MVRHASCLPPLRSSIGQLCRARRVGTPQEAPGQRSSPLRAASSASAPAAMDGMRNGGEEVVVPDWSVGIVCLPSRRVCGVSHRSVRQPV